MQTQNNIKAESGGFLIRKSVFLLTSSVGNAMAETLVGKAVAQIGATPESLTKQDIAKLAGVLEPSLREFLGSEKARKLSSALRVLVGGITPV